jgi:hypothetical protein
LIEQLSLMTAALFQISHCSKSATVPNQPLFTVDQASSCGR